MTPSELLQVQQRFERLAPRAEEAGFGRGDAVFRNHPKLSRKGNLPQMHADGRR